MNMQNTKEPNEKPQNIHERIYNFVIKAIALTRLLHHTPENLIIINQLVKSATSMGANDQEADAAESRKDFIAKYCIVKKENKETNYWLKLVGDTTPELQEETRVLQQEGLEILRIISKIIINTKNKA